MNSPKLPDSMDELLDLLEKDSEKRQTQRDAKSQSTKDNDNSYTDTGLAPSGAGGSRFRNEVSSASSSLKASLGLGKKVIEHPLIAFTLSLTRRPIAEKQINTKNGDSLISISTREIDGIGELPLPCCKPSRSFCILLLQRLANKSITNSVIGIEIGSNFSEEGSKLGVARSGKTGKADFREHVIRVYGCEYNNDLFGSIKKIDGKWHLIIGGEMATGIRTVVDQFDINLFSELMDMLDTERLQEIKTTYAIDLYLIVTDRLMFNVKKTEQLIRWQELHPLNGWKLANIEDYIEEMRGVFYKVVGDRKDVKLTKEGLLFYPNGS